MHWVVHPLRPWDFTRPSRCTTIAIFVENILEYIQKKHGRVRANIVSSFLQYPTIFIQNILGPQFANILRDEHRPMENSKIMIPKQPKNLWHWASKKYKLHLPRSVSQSVTHWHFQIFVRCLEYCSSKFVATGKGGRQRIMKSNEMRRNVMERGGDAHIVKSNGWGQKQPICEEQVQL